MMNIAPRLEVVRMVMNTKFRKLHGADGEKMNMRMLVASPEVTSGGAR
jgi:hypothetical protein